MLKAFHTPNLIEAGCDEAGRGCLAGPVYAAAVILPRGYKNKILNDSKQLTPEIRNELRMEIEEKALAWAVASVTNEEIDEINILNASIMAMHKAIKALKIIPQLLLIDGNRFSPFENLDHHCIVQGDGIYASIAAASILAKTHRDAYMENIHDHFPQYSWNTNKGYATEFHRNAISMHGITPFHRRSFNMNKQLKIDFR